MPRDHFRAFVCRIVVVGGLLAPGLLAGCLASPRGGDQLAHADDPLVIEGVVDRADVPVAVEGYDHAARRWVSIGRVDPTDFVATASPLGTAYRFRAELRLPEAAGYFVAGKRLDSLQARVRARQGGRALASFDADGEGCLRALVQSEPAQASTLTGAMVSAALARCAAKGSPSVEIAVPHCGGEGQSCCARFGGAEDALCEPDLACEPTASTTALDDAERALVGAKAPARQKLRCVRPSYAVPWLRDRAEDLQLPEGTRLREAWLELDDTSVGASSRVVLVSKHAPAPGVALESPAHEVTRLRFDVPFFRPGNNRYRVVALVESAAGIDQRQTPWQSVDYDPGSRLGHLGQGRFKLPLRHFPMWMRDCRGPACRDRDGDGLSDLWENVALEQLRPRLLLDADDSVFDTRDAVRVLSSIVPLRRGDRDYVLFAHVVAFARDFGPPGLFRLIRRGHAGDTEAFGMAFAVQPDGELRWAASVAKGHQCLTCKPTWHWEGQDFDTDGVPLVAVEEHKHGLWQRRSACQHEAGFDCEADRVMRPPAINAGDAHVGGAAAIVDVLDDVEADGPHAALAGTYPGEALWSGGRARLPGRFCGGRRKGCSASKSALLPGDVLGSVVERFRTQRW